MKDAKAFKLFQFWFYEKSLIGFSFEDLVSVDGEILKVNLIWCCQDDSSQFFSSVTRFSVVLHFFSLNIRL